MRELDLLYLWHIAIRKGISFDDEYLRCYENVKVWFAENEYKDPKGLDQLCLWLMEGRYDIIRLNILISKQKDFNAMMRIIDSEIKWTDLLLSLDVEVLESHEAEYVKKLENNEDNKNKENEILSEEEWVKKYGDYEEGKKNNEEAEKFCEDEKLGNKEFKDSGSFAKRMNSRRHLFHLVNPSPWPILVSFSALFLTSGFAFYTHDVTNGGYTSIMGLFLSSYCAFFRSSDIIDEATCSGYHTKVVVEGLRSGSMLFTVSEVMVSMGFSWAFFHGALCPALELGMVYPPIGIVPINVWEFPSFNTCLLITSGLSVTWAHESIDCGSFKKTIDALLWTIFMGFFFVFLQVIDIMKQLLIILIVFIHVHFIR